MGGNSERLILSGRYAKRNRPKIGSAGFAWLKILQTLMPDDPNLHQQADRLRTMIRHEGLDDRTRLAAIFDPDLTNLSDLDIGFFDKKAVTLPDHMVPDSRDDLSRLCRQLIDKGEDIHHIREMTKSFPRGLDLEAHSSTLFDLRETSDELYRRVVQGYHGEAIILFKQLSPTVIKVDDFKALLSRQNLIWCAMDVQMVASGARTTSERPFASFLIGNMKEAKGATILRLMRGALATLRLSIAKYNTLEENPRRQKSDQRLETPLEKLIGMATKRHLKKQFDINSIKLKRLKALLRGRVRTPA